MARLSKRIEKLEEERGSAGRPVIVHVFPGQTEEQALAAHERANGRIPEGVDVTLIRHTFISAL
jgi:alkanesulfonate monooxygenase SsuD/methylene tetrahydromethanopterin reductase-like flavin-dependent oxidoreductase (luciferase family)